MISIVELYEEGLRREGVLKARMDPKRSFRELTHDQVLAHAHYLCDGVKEYARDAKFWDKANRHLTAIQNVPELRRPV